VIDSIVPRGKLVHECRLPGEGRELNVYPAHPNAAQLSEDRWLLIFSTRASRGNDDEKSIVYQVRAGSVEGPVLNEGWIRRSVDDWDPLSDGKKYVRQHGHPTVFGVPRGALIDGTRVAHENIFVCMWRTVARWIDPALNYLQDPSELPDLARQTQKVEWLQFRLNDAGDDIEVIVPSAQLRQKGFEAGERICANGKVENMNAGFVCAVAANSLRSEWICCHHVNIGADPRQALGGQVGAGLVPLRFEFDPASGRYEWVEVGRRVIPGLYESSTIRWGGEWIVCGRRYAHDVVGWVRGADLFDGEFEMELPADQPNRAPVSCYLCPDGVIRRLGGCVERSPYESHRDPIYAVEIDPRNCFSASGHEIIFDGRAAGLPMQGGPLIDFPKLVSHAGGRVQTVLYRARSQMLNDPKRPERHLLQDEIDASGIYFSQVYYDREYPGAWSF